MIKPRRLVPLLGLHTCNNVHSQWRAFKTDEEQEWLYIPRVLLPVETFRVTRRLRYPQCNWAVKSLLPWWHVRATVSHGQSIWVLVLFYMYSTVKIKKTHAFMKHNSSATTRIISKRSMMDIWSVKGRSAASWMETNCVMHWSRAPRCQSRVG